MLSFWEQNYILLRYNDTTLVDWAACIYHLHPLSPELYGTLTWTLSTPLSFLLRMLYKIVEILEKPMCTVARIWPPLLNGFQFFRPKKSHFWTIPYAMAFVIASEVFPQSFIARDILTNLSSWNPRVY